MTTFDDGKNEILLTSYANSIELSQTSKGEKGEQGEKGDQGEQGPQGVQGPAGAGVPSGGTAGQILAKKSNADADTEWVNQPNSAEWGNITGTLADQLDLKNALDSKIEPGDNVSELNNDAGYTSNAGTVTSVGLSVPTGLSVANSPVTSSGTIAVSHSSGYQAYTSAEASKLSGIEAGAEVNPSQYLEDVIAGTNVTIDKTDPMNPVISSTGGGGVSEWGDITGTLSDQSDLQNALDGKVDKVSGKGLSEEDYTSSEKNKLSGIEAGAEVNVQSDWNAPSGDAHILNKPTLGTAAAANVTDFATAAQGSAADTAVQPGDLAAVATTGNYSDLSGTPTIPAAQVNSDWNSVTGVSEILNKPVIPADLGDLADVDTSGATSGDVLTFDGTGWEPAAGGGGGGGQTLYDAVVAPSGGDYTSVSAAVSGGARSIFVRNGTYTESGFTLTTAGHFLSIVGESREHAILKPTARFFTTRPGRMTNLTFMPPATTLSGNNNGWFYIGARFVIDNVHFSGENTSSLLVTSPFVYVAGAYSAIRDCFFENSSHNQIRFQEGCTGLDISKNSFQGLYHGGNANIAYISGYCNAGQWWDVVLGATIQGNTFLCFNNTAAPALGHHIPADGNRIVYLVDSSVTGNTYYSSSQPTLSNNWSAMACFGVGDGCSFEGNVIFGRGLFVQFVNLQSTGLTFYTTGITMTGNRLDDRSARSTTSNQPMVSIRGIGTTVTGNSIQALSNTIGLHRVLFVNGERCVITGNHITGTRSGTESVRILSGADYSIVTSNIVQGGDGITDNSTGTIISDNQVI